MRKIALLGGSFNPIHEGHIAIAKAIHKELCIREIWFLPTVETPLKQNELVDFQHRCRMIQLAIKPYRYMKLSKIEASLPKPSYTLNTVMKLKSLYPDVIFYWIIGYDQYLQLSQWYQIENLKEIIEFIVVNRGNHVIDSEFIELPYFEHEASSSKIRNGDFKFLYPSVQKYIEEKVLYFEDFLPQYYDEKRWVHAKSVAEWCKKIAHYYGIDGNAALLSGYLHDIAKGMTREEMLPIMEHYFPSAVHSDVKIWHQFVGYYYAKYHFNIKNRKLLKAILHHTTGSSKAQLSKILYCADKIDDTRSYDTQEFRNLVFKDLNSAFTSILEKAEFYRNKEE